MKYHTILFYDIIQTPKPHRDFIYYAKSSDDILHRSYEQYDNTNTLFTRIFNASMPFDFSTLFPQSLKSFLLNVNATKQIRKNPVKYLVFLFKEHFKKFIKAIFSIKVMPRQNNFFAAVIRRKITAIKQPQWRSNVIGRIYKHIKLMKQKAKMKWQEQQQRQWRLSFFSDTKLENTKVNKPEAGNKNAMAQAFLAKLTEKTPEAPKRRKRRKKIKDNTRAFYQDLIKRLKKPPAKKRKRKYKHKLHKAHKLHNISPFTFKRSDLYLAFSSRYPNIYQRLLHNPEIKNLQAHALALIFKKHVSTIL